MILKEIKKEKKYYTLIFDDGTCFNCLEELIVSNLLLIGKKISEEELEDLKNQNEYFKYYDLALGYISKNMCSKNKLNNYLLRKEANNMIIEKIINTLKNKKLLDDQKYFNYMTDYYFRHHYGKFYIISKGKQENISDEIINNSLENISYEDFYNSCMELANKYIQSGDISKMPLKLKKYLFQRGYDTDIILNVTGRVNYEERKIY